MKWHGHPARGSAGKHGPVARTASCRRDAGATGSADTFLSEAFQTLSAIRKRRFPFTTASIKRPLR